jgi:CDP-diacylglycerol--serine O-phosphatidyltransferase
MPEPAPITSEAPAVREAVPAAPAPTHAFGVKDLFTAWNLFGGVMSIVSCIEGDIRWAGYWLLIGYLGDIFDGMVARATHGSNRFGAEFDNIVDHLTQAIAPAVIVYVGFKDLGRPVAIGLATLLILTGSIRHARSAVKKCNFSLCWVGLPRTVSMLSIVSYLNASIWPYRLGGKWGGAVLVVTLALLNLIPLPFLSHHGRNLQWYARLSIAGFFGTVAVTVLVPRLHPYIFDGIFAWMVGYVLGGWTPMLPEEKREFFRVTRQWLRDIAAAK